MKPTSLRPYLAALLVWGLAFLVTTRVGAVPDADWELILQLRVPRAVLAAAVGMGLAVSGAVLQALFANPLCEPYTLGISSGASLGAVAGAVFGITGIFAGFAGSSFAGALAFGAILYVISRRPESGNFTLLLSGVMLGFFGSSLVAVWMALADVNGIQGTLFWLLGDLSRARLRPALVLLASAAFLVFALWRRWRELDALLLGEEEALAVGVDVVRARRGILVLCSLLIAACVSSAGMIGFIGLVVPHFARRFVGSLHGRLIPLCAIWGAAALTLSDGLARFAVRPFELPVGVVTALVGAPVFLWMILTPRGRAIS